MMIALVRNTLMRTLMYIALNPPTELMAGFLR